LASTAEQDQCLQDSGKGISHTHKQLGVRKERDREKKGAQEWCKTLPLLDRPRAKENPNLTKRKKGGEPDRLKKF